MLRCHGHAHPTRQPPVSHRADRRRGRPRLQRGADPLAERLPPLHVPERALPLHVIADNASTDETLDIALRLAAELPEVTALRLGEKGRGRALHDAWSSSDAPVLAYMDVDLSTDLDAFLPLVAPLVSGHSDIAIGSRLVRSARVRRGLKREFVSRTYNRILHLTLRSRFSDAQCGFKAIRADRAAVLLRPALE